MDLNAGKIIRNYALDSTGVQQDSVLIWQERLYAYETDLRLARHYLFQGSLTAYDSWIASIPQRVELEEWQAVELTDFAALFETLRPYRENGIALNRLPASVLDSLAWWAADCDEPGAIAREIMRRNGRDETPVCAGAEARTKNMNRPDPAVKINRIAPAWATPNPSRDYLILNVADTSAPVAFTLSAPDGRVLAQRILLSTEQMPIDQLPNGLYFCHFAGAGGWKYAQKIIILH
ncbi:MAG: T9SS type A sorting domain-containing protein [Saprospiraceae bacterium]|nr:T9SS type A sorting domain-containing protein [Saprospiraceae bacterium]